MPSRMSRVHRRNDRPFRVCYFGRRGCAAWYMGHNLRDFQDFQEEVTATAEEFMETIQEEIQTTKFEVHSKVSLKPLRLRLKPWQHPSPTRSQRSKKQPNLQSIHLPLTRSSSQFTLMPFKMPRKSKSCRNHPPASRPIPSLPPKLQLFPNLCLRRPNTMPPQSKQKLQLWLQKSSPRNNPPRPRKLSRGLKRKFLSQSRKPL